MSLALLIVRSTIGIALLCSPLVCRAQEGKFIGDWCFTNYTEKSNLPYMSFDIAIQPDKKGGLEGKYCSISYYGSRIDCEPGDVANVHGAFSQIDNQVDVVFASAFGGKNGRAVLYFSGEQLHWRVDKAPVGGGFYGPYSAALVKCGTAPPVWGVILSEKEYLRVMPSNTSPTRGYLVKGDRVSLLAVSDDTKFFKIRYQRNNGKSIDGWIRYQQFTNEIS